MAHACSHPPSSERIGDKEKPCGVCLSCYDTTVACCFLLHAIVLSSCLLFTFILQRLDGPILNVVLVINIINMVFFVKTIYRLYFVLYTREKCCLLYNQFIIVSYIDRIVHTCVQKAQYICFFFPFIVLQYKHIIVVVVAAVDRACLLHNYNVQP